MAYFYVKNSIGTRTTGGGLTKQTGSFTALGASNVYANIENAITDGATSGDFICVSDAHSYTTAATTQYGGPTTGDFLYIVTVDDANCDAEAVASAYQEYHTSTLYLGWSGRIAFFGCYFESDNDFRHQGDAGQYHFENCTFETNNTSDYLISSLSDGSYTTYMNCTFIGPATGATRVASGNVMTLINCSFSGPTNLWTASTGLNGGAHIHCIGCDLSGITGSLWADGGSAPAIDDVIQVRYTNCKLNATEPTFVTETLENMGHRLVMANTSGSSTAAEYQYYVASYGGVVQDETSIYRDGSTAFPSGQKISLKCTTDTNATPAAPFWFDFPARYAALSSTSTDNLRIYLISTATLYDSDVWAEVIYPDGTNKQTPNYLSTRHTDIMDTNGTGLTTNSESWTGDTGETLYQIDIDTSADAGADSVPIIRVYVAKASTVIYFCPTIGLS